MWKKTSNKSANECLTGEFGDKVDVINKHSKQSNFVKEFTDSDIPEFTLGPSKFLGHPVGKHSNKKSTLNPEDKENDSGLRNHSSQMRKTFYTMAESPTKSVYQAGKQRTANESSIEAFQVESAKKEITDTPNFKKQRSRVSVKNLLVKSQVRIGGRKIKRSCKVNRSFRCDSLQRSMQV